MKSTGSYIYSDTPGGWLGYGLQEHMPSRTWPNTNVSTSPKTQQKGGYGLSENAHGASELSEPHRAIMARSNGHGTDALAPKWGLSDTLDYLPAWLKVKPAKSTHVFDFKNNWVSHYKDLILDAAAKNDLPPELLAGTAYNEVGGMPEEVKHGVYGMRELHIPHLGTLSRDADWTSFGDIAMQPRRAAASLGYDPATLSAFQRRQLIQSLEDPIQNIYIAAKHLSDLRDHDFPIVPASQLTSEQVQVIGARYNAGPDLTIHELKNNKDAMSYGRNIVVRWDALAKLLGIQIGAGE